MCGVDLPLFWRRSRNCFFYIAAGVVATVLFGNTALAVQWWWQASVLMRRQTHTLSGILLMALIKQQ